MNDDPDVPAVLALLRAASAADGVRPLSEESELRLQHGGPPGGGDLVVRDGGELAGYARYDAGADGGVEAELVVHPSFRRRGHGRALLDRLVELAGARPLSLWAHGDRPGSAELLAPRGFVRARVLLQMRLRLDARDLDARHLDARHLDARHLDARHLDGRDLPGVGPAPRPQLPDGVHVAAFRPGRDEAAWLRQNARAFAAHPEQGSWTPDDLLLREKEPWFDPDGFLLAWRGDPDDGGELLGSHWTKIHPPGDVADEPVGEVYVLGIDPAAQGMRLGTALTELGLAHLRSRGLAQVLLYVEEENAAAVRLYEGRGFRRFSVDVSWRRDPR